MSTIREVAARAGVSVTTVSRAINHRGYMSQEMRDRIQRAMEELDYQPNEVARSLSFQHTHMIGVLVPELINPFFAEVVSVLSALLTARGYRMLLYIASGTDDRAPDYIGMLRANQVDGIIVSLRSREIERDLRGDLPVVSFERLNTGSVPAVQCDNLQGGRLAAEELLATGARRPLMVGGRHATDMPAFDRFQGYSETVREAGCPVHIFEINEEQCHGNYAAAAQEALRQYPDTDGIFCTSDVIASHVLQEVLRLGRRVPEDVRIVGFNDSTLARQTAIPLTSVRQPIEEMCAAAVDCLMKQIHHESGAMGGTFPVTLSRRASTRGREIE